MKKKWTVKGVRRSDGTYMDSDGWIYFTKRGAMKQLAFVERVRKRLGWLGSSFYYVVVNTETGERFYDV